MADRFSYDLQAVQQLLREWDPIGVYVGPETEWPSLDEYDVYAFPVLSHLQRGSTPEEIAHLLSSFETKNMGMPPRPERTMGFANRILQWWSARDVCSMILNGWKVNLLEFYGDRKTMERFDSHANLVEVPCRDVALLLYKGQEIGVTKMIVRIAVLRNKVAPEILARYKEDFWYYVSGTVRLLDDNRTAAVDECVMSSRGIVLRERYIDFDTGALLHVDERHLR